MGLRGSTAINTGRGETSLGLTPGGQLKGPTPGGHLKGQTPGGHLKGQTPGGHLQGQTPGDPLKGRTLGDLLQAPQTPLIAEQMCHLDGSMREDKHRNPCQCYKHTQGVPIRLWVAYHVIIWCCKSQIMQKCSRD